MRLEKLMIELPLIVLGTSHDLTVTFGAKIQASDQSWLFETSADGFEGAKRLLGCAFIAAIPPDGIDEALQSLGDIYEYFRPLLVEADQPIRLIPAAAVTGESRERPGLALGQ